MTGELCPHCFAPPRADGRPGCACAARGSDRPDALRPSTSGPGTADTAVLPGDGTRAMVSAEAAAGAGPNPDDLRLFDDDRPAAGGTGTAWTDEAGTAGRAGAGTAGRAGGAATGARSADGSGTGPAAADTTGAHGAASGAQEGTGGSGTARPASHRRRRPVAIVIAAAVLVAVVGTVAFGTGLLGGDGGGDGAEDRALPDDRATSPSTALPTWDGKMTTSAPPTPGGTTAPSPAATPSRTGGPSPSATGSATPSASEPTAPTSPSAPAAPPAPRPSASEGADEPSERPTPSPPTPTAPPEPSGPPVLRQGDTGPEVAELQDRLRQTWTYGGTVDGEYDAGVADAVGTYQRRHDITGDPEGVYGPHTRDYLEARTDEP